MRTFGIGPPYPIGGKFRIELCFEYRVAAGLNYATQLLDFSRAAGAARTRRIIIIIIYSFLGYGILEILIASSEI